MDTSLSQEANTMTHVGVDLHKRTSQIAVLTEDGELTQQRLVNDVAGVE
jgi:hypothetical protein